MKRTKQRGEKEWNRVDEGGKRGRMLYDGEGCKRGKRKSRK